MPDLIARILGFVVNVYIFIMWGRLILDYVQLFARNWKPKGILLVLCEAVYTVTDPPLKFIRRFVPPLRVGSVAIDLGWMILMFALIILVNVLVFV